MSKRRHFQPPTQPSQQAVLTQTTQTISSPYPLPAQAEAFERVAPGIMREILATAQESIRFQQGIQDKSVNAAINHETHRLNTVRWVVWPAGVGAFVLAATNKDLPSYGLLFSYLAALVGAILYSRNKNQSG